MYGRSSGLGMRPSKQWQYAYNIENNENPIIKSLYHILNELNIYLDV